MKFPKEDLLELLDGEGFDRYEFIANQNLGKGRWSSHHELIFKVDGKLYGAWYECGLTEYQETYPWDNEGDEAECYPVVPIEKTIVTYKRVG